MAPAGRSSYALPQMGDPRSPAPDADPEADALRAALRRGTSVERAAAIESAPPAPGVEAILADALDDPEVAVRTSAVRVLARIARARGTRALMRAATNDPSPAVRAEAVAALGRVLAARLGPEEEPPSLGRPV